MSFGFHASLQKDLYSSITQFANTPIANINSIQIYIGGNSTYTRRNFTSNDLLKSKMYLDATGFRLYTHSCLCMNLASGFDKNVETLKQELIPINATGASTVVHIGSKNVAKEPIGTMDNVVETIRKLNLEKRQKKMLYDINTSSFRNKIQPYPLLLENAAGEGAKFGSSLDDLEYLFSNLKNEAVGFCLDTAHAYGAGVFDFNTEDNILDMFDVVDDTVGIGRLQLIHLNDSKIKFGGNNDRHENLGDGFIWSGDKNLVCLEFLMKECKRRNVDLILETPEVMNSYLIGVDLLKRRK